MDLAPLARTVIHADVGRPHSESLAGTADGMVWCGTLVYHATVTILTNLHVGLANLVTGTDPPQSKSILDGLIVHECHPLGVLLAGTAGVSRARAPLGFVSRANEPRYQLEFRSPSMLPSSAND